MIYCLNQAELRIPPESGLNLELSENFKQKLFNFFNHLPLDIGRKDITILDKKSFEGLKRVYSSLDQAKHKQHIVVY